MSNLQSILNVLESDVNESNIEALKEEMKLYNIKPNGLINKKYLDTISEFEFDENSNFELNDKQALIVIEIFKKELEPVEIKIIKTYEDNNLKEELFKLNINRLNDYLNDNDKLLLNTFSNILNKYEIEINQEKLINNLRKYYVTKDYSDIYFDFISKKNIDGDKIEDIAKLLFNIYDEFNKSQRVINKSIEENRTEHTKSGIEIPKFAEFSNDF